MEGIVGERIQITKALVALGSDIFRSLGMDNGKVLCISVQQIISSPEEVDKGKY